MKLKLVLVIILFSSCSSVIRNNDADMKRSTKIKSELFFLERKWIEAEFALDTAYIANLLDSTFYSVADNHISNKQQEIKGIYDNMSAMRRDSIFLDSLTLEDSMINIYGNMAVVFTVFHSYKKDKGRPIEKRTRFYDVWISRDGQWKVVSSQGTILK